LPTVAFPVSHRDHEDKLIQQGGDVLRSVAPNMVMIWKQLGFPPAKMEERLRAAISHHKVQFFNFKPLKSS